MTKDQGASAPSDAELSPDHCPNCGRPLKFPESQTEALCISCGIFVEILKPLPGPSGAGRPHLTRELILASPKRDLERLCRAYKLPTSGHKSDLAARLLEYIQKHPEEPATTAPEGSPGLAPETEVMDVEKRKAMANLLLELEAALSETEGEIPTDAGQVAPDTITETEARASAKDETAVVPTPTPPPAAVAEGAEAAEPAPQPPPAAVAESEGAIETALETALETAHEEAMETEASVEPTPQEAITEVEEVVEPEPAAGEAVPEEEVQEEEVQEEEIQEEEIQEEEIQEEAQVSAEDEDQQVLEEVFWGSDTETTEEAPARAVEESTARAKPAAWTKMRLRHDRRVFHAGAALTALGGSGLLLGSFVHDLFRVPFVGRAYEVFGPINVVAAFLGVIMLSAGLAAMAFGLRGGVIPKRAAPGV